MNIICLLANEVKGKAHFMREKKINQNYKGRTNRIFKLNSAIKNRI